MTNKTFTLQVQESGERIDALLARLSPEPMSRSAAARLLGAGKVTVNGAPAAKNYRAAAGDVVCVERDEPAPAQAEAQEIPLDVVYEDGELIVVNKPRGMVVHPAPGHADGTLVNALLAHCGGSLSGVGGVLRPGIVHRLDKDTSGLLIAAKNDRAHECLSAQLKDRSLSRARNIRFCAIPEIFTLRAPAMSRWMMRHCSNADHNRLRRDDGTYAE